MPESGLTDRMPAIDATLIEPMRGVVREAGLLAFDYYRAARSNNTWHKDDGSAVSEADIAVDHLLRQKLLELRPDYGWLSEETQDDLVRLDRSRVFIVDPIDGTRAFLAGRPHWVVSAALVVEGEVAIGLLYNPVADELFEAVAGAGARLNGEPIRVGGRAELEGCTVIAAPDRFKSRHWPQPWPLLATFMVNSIAYRLALVAANRADAVLSLSGKSEWDLAAAALILREAGGIVTDHRGEALRFNQRHPHCVSVLAANPPLHRQMLLRTRQVEASGKRGCAHT